MHWITSQQDRPAPELKPRRLRTLVVDDLLQVVRAIGIFLESQDGVEVTGTAESGIQALDQCAVLRPDLVLMDHGLPDIDGRECARLIRERFPEIIVVLISGDDGLAWQCGGPDSGVHGFVAKSRIHHDLIPEISHIIQNLPELSAQLCKFSRHCT